MNKIIRFSLMAGTLLTGLPMHAHGDCPTGLGNRPQNGFTGVNIEKFKKGGRGNPGKFIRNKPQVDPKAKPSPKPTPKPKPQPDPAPRQRPNTPEPAPRPMPQPEPMPQPRPNNPEPAPKPMPQPEEPARKPNNPEPAPRPQPTPQKNAEQDGGILRRAAKGAATILGGLGAGALINLLDPQNQPNNAPQQDQSDRSKQQPQADKPQGEQPQNPGKPTEPVVIDNNGTLSDSEESDDDMDIRVESEDPSSDSHSSSDDNPKVTTPKATTSDSDNGDKTDSDPSSDNDMKIRVEDQSATSEESDSSSDENPKVTTPKIVTPSDSEDDLVLLGVEDAKNRQKNVDDVNRAGNGDNPNADANQQEDIINVGVDNNTNPNEIVTIRFGNGDNAQRMRVRRTTLLLSETVRQEVNDKTNAVIFDAQGNFIEYIIGDAAHNPTRNELRMMIEALERVVQFVTSNGSLAIGQERLQEIISSATSLTGRNLQQRDLHPNNTRELIFSHSLSNNQVLRLLDLTRSYDLMVLRNYLKLSYPQLDNQQQNPPVLPPVDDEEGLDDNDQQGSQQDADVLLALLIELSTFRNTVDAEFTQLQAEVAHGLECTTDNCALCLRYHHQGMRDAAEAADIAPKIATFRRNVFARYDELMARVRAAQPIMNNINTNGITAHDDIIKQIHTASINIFTLTTLQDQSVFQTLVNFAQSEGVNGYGAEHAAARVPIKKHIDEMGKALNKLNLRLRQVSGNRFLTQPEQAKNVNSMNEKRKLIN